ncbi:MAG: hypothetical protein GY780_11450 [bacterium]|nr:hypothetical protein [bacterium]
MKQGIKFYNIFSPLLIQLISHNSKPSSCIFRQNYYNYCNYNYSNIVAASQEGTAMRYKLSRIIPALLIPITVIFLINGKKDSNMSNTIDHSQIGGPVTITGLLGKPIGQLITATGTVVDPDTRRMRSDSDKQLLQIEYVNNQPLPQPVIIPVRVFAWESTEIPPIGTEFSCFGYETGGMEGVPEEAFDYISPVATTQYHFYTHFQVCKIAQ